MNDYSLNKTALEVALRERSCEIDLHFFEQTSSTFDESARINPKAPALIVARRQSSGRGRLGRTWQSDEGGIYLSLILEPCVAREKLQLMTAICAVGIRRTIGRYTSCKIKWPNDIVSHEGKKLCGILAKLNSDPKNKTINIGIGINANNGNFPNELKYASSISETTGKKIDENVLTASLVSELMQICARADINGILHEYEAELINLGKRVRLIYQNGKGEEVGLCIGTDDTGALIIKNDDGKISALSSGEVSVRGVYGEYV